MYTLNISIFEINLLVTGASVHVVCCNYLLILNTRSQTCLELLFHGIMTYNYKQLFWTKTKYHYIQLCGQRIRLESLVSSTQSGTLAEVYWWYESQASLSKYQVTRTEMDEGVLFLVKECTVVCYK